MWLGSWCFVHGKTLMNVHIRYDLVWFRSSAERSLETFWYVAHVLLPLKFASRSAFCLEFRSAAMCVVFSHCARWSPAFTSSVKVLTVATRNKVNSVNNRLSATTFRNLSVFGRALPPVMFSREWMAEDGVARSARQKSPNPRTVYFFLSFLKCFITHTEVSSEICPLQ